MLHQLSAMPSEIHQTYLGILAKNNKANCYGCYGAGYFRAANLPKLQPRHNAHKPFNSLANSGTTKGFRYVKFIKKYGQWKDIVPMKII